jgi:hypothetical protein
MGSIAVYLEVAKRRTFAAAVEWPGWCRSGKTEDEALGALAGYGSRYAKAIGRTAGGLKVSKSGPTFDVVERVRGNATTEFGAPGAIPRLDEAPLSAEGAKRLTSLLRSAWRAFDRTAERAEGRQLAKGPRGGGRSLAAMVAHVHDAEGAYLSKIGGPTRAPASDDELSSLFVRILTSRAKGDPPPRIPRSGGVWPIPYAVRRSAWHALDHAWEIEDRTTPD